MPKTRKTYSKTGTRRNYKNAGGSNSLQKFEQEVIVRFLEVLNLVKLYHWKTHSYATHKATDELGANLQGTIDTFVEVLLGKRGDRVNLTHKKQIALKDYSSVGEFKRELEAFKSYLVSFDKIPALKTMSNNDLFNIRDEMLGDMNQFLYLLSFNK